MVEIPLQIITLEDSGFHLLVEVSVLGRTFPAVLDTGASKTVWDKTVILSLLDDPTALQQTSLLSTGLGTNTMESFAVTLPEIRLGDWKMGSQTWAVLDLAMINYAYSQLNIPPVLGVIGGDLLYPYGAIIDYRKQKLRLRQRKLRV